jgi:ABC-type uncharacterized transport system ATPase subunit
MKLTILKTKLKKSKEFFFDENESDKMIYCIENFIDKTNLNKKVIVVFLNIPQEEKIRDEQDAILISHNFDEIMIFCDRIIRYNNKVYHKHTKNWTLVLNEFKSYKEAFEYCIDLKEGF